MAGEGLVSPDRSVGLRAISILTPTFTVALAVYVIRIWTRSRPKFRLNATDYTISVAILAETASLALTAVAVSRGYGSPRSLLSADDKEIIGRTTFSVFIISLWASAFARVSICCLLLRITTSKLWTVILWSNIVFQILTLTTSDIVSLLQCRPIQANWTFVPGGSCIPKQEIWIFVCLSGAIGMTGDVLCAVLPIVLIWRLSRSVVEKVLVSILLGLGLVAAVGGVLKLIILRSWVPTAPNAQREIVDAFLWVRLEEILLIIGACAPALKRPIESLLHRFGLPQFGPVERELNSVHTVPETTNKPERCIYDGPQGSWSGGLSPAPEA